MIVTLHDSNVMNLNIFRQDEIWFMERKEDHRSELYSLNKFKERFDHSVAKDYLLGRYGAIQFLGLMMWMKKRGNKMEKSFRLSSDGMFSRPEEIFPETPLRIIFCR